MKQLGTKTDEIKDVYIKQVRSLLEYAVSVWHSSLTGEDRIRIEKVQKCALHIILGQNYNSYSSARKQLGLETLFERRRKLCLKFAKKAANSPKFSKWFKVYTTSRPVRNRKPKNHEVFSRLKRYEKSPISYLTSLLNIA